MKPPEFQFSQFNPFPLDDVGVMDRQDIENSESVSFEWVFKYLFTDKNGNHVHEYVFPNSYDILNCGGYIDKLLKYRDQRLLEHFRSQGVNIEALQSDDFPILNHRSPQLDLIIYEIITTLLKDDPKRRISLFDHGCTVAEHFDMLDIMLRASSDDCLQAKDVISYCGVDAYALLIAAAKIMHLDVPEEHFQLISAEGSEFDLPAFSFDVALSVGVINQVEKPLQALENMIRLVKKAVVLAIWITAEEEGYWTVFHRGSRQYCFSFNDLRKVKGIHPDGRFLVADFTPETEATQVGHFVGMGKERIKNIGSYHLIYTTSDLSLDYPQLSI